MKLLLAIAVLLNIYGVLSVSEQKHHHHKHRQQAHHNHHNNGNTVNELTVDELANVLVSLPGSLGRNAYRTFLSLNEFLPADTKAHKFFMAIPDAIRKKSNGEISELRRIPTTSLMASPANPIFMVQPVGYHMVPLPLHPMFSSSPMDYFTRVPCAHTKMIRVPMHTFDVQFSATTRRFGPVQSTDDDDDDDDSKNSDENAEANENALRKILDSIGSGSGNEDLEKLFDMISASDSEHGEDDNDFNEQPDNEDSNKESQENNPEKGTESDSTAQDGTTPDSDDTTPSSDQPIVEEPANQNETAEVELPTEDVENPPAPEESSPLTEDQAPPADQTTPPQEEETASIKEEETAPMKDEPAQSVEEIVQPKEESEQEQEKLLEEPAADISTGKKGKKKKGQPTKKGKKSQAEPKADSTEANVPAPSPEPSEQPAAEAEQKEVITSEEDTKRIPGKKARRKKPKAS